MILTATINEVKRRVTFDNPNAVVAVKGDYEVNGVAFAFPAIYEDDFDLSTAVKTVYYKATDGIIYNHVVTDTDTDTGYPLWVFKDEINKGAYGDVEFALVCDKVEGGNIVKRWVSMITVFRVQKSIEIDESEQEENEQTYSERLAYLMTQMANMQATVSGLASGAPTPVSLASAMTDTSRLYVYTGSESGYTAGHWYYYNGSAWADGGQYGGTSVDATLTVSGAAADAKVVGDEIAEVKEDLSDKFKAGNNLFALNGDYENTFSGVHIIIKNGIITINGTSTNAITLKLTGGYDIASRAKDEWDDEVVSFFEIGKTYHYGIETVSGTFPDGVGCPGRANRTSVISVSIPVKTIEIQPHYIMLYIPTSTNVNCSFIPYYIESYTGNNLYRSKIADNVKLSRKQLPTAEFNHFTVTVKDANGTDKVTQCVVTLPSSYDIDGKPTQLIMFCHGREGIVTETEWADSADKLALIRHFTNSGYGVFDVDATSHPSAGAIDVGCPQLMESYIKAFEYIKDKYNVDGRLILYGYSFGTFALMNMLCWYPALIRTACISAMRASVRAVYDRGEPYQTEIATNFGFTGGYNPEKMQGYDPYSNIINVGNADMLMKQIPPIKILTSTVDTLELEQSHTLINAWRASGNVIDWKEVTGSNHHDMCYLSGTASSLKAEIIAWFNRYI